MVVTLLIIGFPDGLPKGKSRLGDVLAGIIINTAGHNVFVLHPLHMPHSALIARLLRSKHDVSEFDNHLKTASVDVDILCLGRGYFKVRNINGLKCALSLIFIFIFIVIFFVPAVGVWFNSVRPRRIDQIGQDLVEKRNEFFKNKGKGGIKTSVVTWMEIIDVRVDFYAACWFDFEFRREPLVPLRDRIVDTLRRKLPLCNFRKRNRPNFPTANILFPIFDRGRKNARDF
mmetsp:Transcript_29763/g.48062  ORF Transcript_29763/g.48062 Transcript_29763/m.48062 type:complete len:230 (+) Transcript_29763:1054-1743(+)